MIVKKQTLTVCLMTIISVLGACALGEHTAFDLETEKTGQVDKSGFPVFVGKKYDRDVPLKGTVERAKLESELQALAETRKGSAGNVNVRQNEILQQKLKQAAQTHGDTARAQIEAACKTDANGVVICNAE